MSCDICGIAIKASRCGHCKKFDEMATEIAERGQKVSVQYFHQLYKKALWAQVNHILGARNDRTKTTQRGADPISDGSSDADRCELRAKNRPGRINVQASCRTE